MKEIEEATQALELLTCEFVDPDEELYLQERSFKYMPGFARLPLELRVMIWKATFPAGRLLPANLESYFVLWRPPVREPRSLPVALHINQESRLETKKHYLILLPDEVPDMALDYVPRDRAAVSERQTLCVALARDFVYHTEGGWCWANQLSEMMPGLWDRLRQLVIGLSGFEDHLGEIVEGVACYPGLKHLKLVQPRIPRRWLPPVSDALESQRWMYGNWPKDAEDSKAKLLSMTEERKLKDPGRTIPEITMLPYQRVKKTIWE